MLNRVLIDKGIFILDSALRTLFKVNQSQRPYPAEGQAQIESLSSQEKRHSAGYMRVNHAGEIAAQALYQGQQLTAKNPSIQEAMHQAGQEEIDHLVWCEQRLKELGSHTSYLAPLWFVGALSMGILAGLAGDEWNLGFLAETEKQVGIHLKGHLAKLPLTDVRSRLIVEQMEIDETQHEAMAIAQGAKDLPLWVKMAMQMVARSMTTVAYYL